MSVGDVTAIAGRARVHGPVKHGDLLRLGCRPGDRVLIVDGLFHQAATVRHKEILQLLSDGVAVFGSSSMGALRAAELDVYGMRGVGVVYRMYASGEVEADDEVAVVHLDADEDYRQLSDPMVNVRHAVAVARADGVLDAGTATAILSAARRLHYRERNWRTIIRSVAPAVTGGRLDRFPDWLRANPDGANAKRADARLALTEMLDRPLGQAVGWQSADPSWRTGALVHWIARHRTVSRDGHTVALRSLIRYVQIYDSTFPARWRQLGLGLLAGADRVPVSIRVAEEAAIAAAASRGTEAGHLTGAQFDYWTTTAERATLDRREIFLRTLIRSSRGDLDAMIVEPLWRGHLLGHRWPTAEVVRSQQFNHAFTSQRFVSVADIADRAVAEHLADTWACRLDAHDLTAAGRDRGFPSLGAALDAAKEFILWKMRRTPGSDGR
jgi:hypothetical protein